jgi:hypothetical protein
MKKQYLSVSDLGRRGVDALRVVSLENQKCLGTLFICQGKM